MGCSLQWFPQSFLLPGLLPKPVLYNIVYSMFVQVSEYRHYRQETEDDYANMYWRTDNMEREDGELSWFNSGVRVGVGIGLGICLGIGVGVGLLVRTYQATSRTLRRQII